MKNKTMLLGLFFIFMMFTAIAHAAFISGGLLSVSLAKYEPSPAQAGKYVTVWFDVVNKGNSPAEDITFNLQTKYPFTLPDNDAIKTYSRISGLDSIRIEYRLFVDKNTPNSTVGMTLVYNVGGTGAIEKKFNITVEETAREETTDLRALFVDAKPIAYPTGTSKLSLDIVNLDDGMAYHTMVRADAEFAEIKRNEVFVGNLAGDDFDSVDFDMNIKGVPKGTYTVNITMLYKDTDGNEKIQSNLVYMKVLTMEEALMTSTSGTSAWMYIIYIIVIIVLIRALLIPFVRWFVKPFRKKKSHQ
jgi:hypothetical protein